MQVCAVLILLGFAPCSAANIRAILAAKKIGGDEGKCDCIQNDLKVDKEAPKQSFEGPYISRAAEDGKTSYFPEDYGESCKAWDDLADPKCQSEHPPAYCPTKWCYVSADCKNADKKKSMYFPGKTLHYSYSNCGSFDAFTAIACLEKDQATCSDPCTFNNGVCQNKLCQCTGENNFDAANKKKLGESYGKTCDAWDKESCKTWEDKSELGIWCCKQWCYVEQSCPSAKPSSAAAGLFYSYYSCPDKVSEIGSCPWKKNQDFNGDPVPLSGEASKAAHKGAAAPSAVPTTVVAVAALATAHIAASCF